MALLQLLAAYALVACSQGGSCPSGDVNSLLQVAVGVGSGAERALNVQAPAPVPAPAAYSLVDNTNFICFEGADSNSMKNVVAYPRGSVMAQLDSHMGLLTQSCAEQGFTQQTESPDMCFGAFGASSYVRPGTTAASLSNFSTYVQGLMRTSVAARGLSWDVGLYWASCLTCSGGRTGTGDRWWGADRAYTTEECAQMTPAVITATHAAVISRGSRTSAFVADTAVTCFEGEHDYITASLAMTKRTPFGDLFRNASVHDGSTCADLGYDSVRDLVDDCWPMASKHMRAATENADMGDWVAGPRSVTITNDHFDAVNNLPQGMARNLTSCFACQAGSANRDRGMLVLQDGSASTGGFFTEQCQALMQTACGEYPGALAPALCLAGFSAIYRDEPFVPVPVI